jgi:hypothetical protein
VGNSTDVFIDAAPLIDMQIDRCSSSSDNPDDVILPGAAHASSSFTPRLDMHLFEFFNAIRLKTESSMTSSKASNNERKTVQQIEPDAELNALFVDAKKSGFIVQTSCPEDHQSLRVASDSDNRKAQMLRLRKCNYYTDYDLREARLGHGRDANRSLLKRNKLESHIKLESTF